MSAIRYLNTDLDIACPEDPKLLTKGLKKAGLHAVNVPQLSDGLWIANFETNKQFKESATCVAAILDAIAKLSGDALLQLQSCTLRECNIGFEGGANPQSVGQKLPVELLERMAKTGISLGITIYTSE